MYILRNIAMYVDFWRILVVTIEKKLIAEEEKDKIGGYFGWIFNGGNKIHVITLRKSFSSE